jgi:hypothetical protein
MSDRFGRDSTSLEDMCAEARHEPSILVPRHALGHTAGATFSLNPPINRLLLIEPMTSTALMHHNGW